MPCETIHLSINLHISFISLPCIVYPCIIVFLRNFVQELNLNTTTFVFVIFQCGYWHRQSFLELLSPNSCQNFDLVLRLVPLQRFSMRTQLIPSSSYIIICLLIKLLYLPRNRLQGCSASILRSCISPLSSDVWQIYFETRSSPILMFYDQPYVHNYDVIRETSI